MLKTIIPYPYNVNIYSHLYILIKRFRSGKVNELVEINNLDEDERRIINNYQSVMKVSESVIRNTGDYLNTKLPSIESYYLLQYLISMRYKHDLTFNEQVQPEVLALTKAYISGFNITMNDGRVLTLQNDLISHIKPMLNRLNNRILIVNRLKKDIQTTYTTLFNKVTLISRKYEQLESTDWRISDDEVGFITLYFAKYFEENQTKKRILIMCASGIGTSKLLRVKVLRAFPEVEIVAVVSKYEYEKNIERYYDIDAIISTVNIETQQKVQVILTSAMFTKLDEQHVKEALYGNLY
ncbi:BglG family transcription antiterminator [Latilactobacillus curvatus]|uniref:BglG family transcription antiterminator n=1 Tax=Latilactobacillus curvatus TaxID=28038 RepID=UPI00097539F4|nr:PRD domain-containing protein [Latilactobacillus curvatus]